MAPASKGALLNINYYYFYEAKSGHPETEYKSMDSLSSIYVMSAFMKLQLY